MWCTHWQRLCLFFIFKHSSYQPNHYGNQCLHVQAAGHKLNAMLLFSPSGRPHNCLMSLKSQKSFNRAAVVLRVINTCYCYAVTAEWAKSAPSPAHLLPPSPSTSCFNQFGPIWKRRRPSPFNRKLFSQLGVHTSLGFISFPFQRHSAGRRRRSNRAPTTVVFQELLRWVRPCHARRGGLQLPLLAITPPFFLFFFFLMDFLH